MPGDEHRHRRRYDHQRSKPFRRGDRIGRSLRLPQHHEKDDHEHGHDHNTHEFLGDTGSRVAEAVEDALPVLQVEEHRDAADGQKHD